MPISRKHNFLSNTVILAEDWIEELDQLYRFFAGTISESIIINQNSANVVLIVQNINGSRDVLLLQRGGVSKCSFLANQQFNSILTDVAPILVDSTTKVTNLNASYLDNLPLSSFVLANLVSTEFNVPLVIDDFVDLSTFKSPVFIVPAGTNMTLTLVDFNVVLDVVSGSEITLTLKKNNVSLQSATFDRTSGATFNLSTSVTENDKITFEITNIVTEEGQLFHNLLCNVVFRQDIVT